ncbi:MAG: sterol desaturase family protein [Chitinophagaceae bacterium]|nr:sterol desaturase family protein [Chitinophagaceae bacterium]
MDTPETFSLLPMQKFDSIAFFLLICALLIEFSLMLWYQQKDKARDVKVNLLLGSLLAVLGFFMKGVQFSLYTVVYHVAILHFDPTWWIWVIAFLACDLIHYFYHWLGHRTRLFWAAHVTHHSSLYLNLSTGLRTNFLHLFYRFLFWTPLCYLGFPPEMVMLIESITSIDNFLIHTDHVGKLGVIDRIFNTPSNHRVHHGTSPEYMDKNIGGILMIYDHLFGTYTPETTPAVYGITHNLDTDNPVTIITHEYKRLIRELPRIKGAANKIRYLFSRPT